MFKQVTKINNNYDAFYSEYLKKSEENKTKNDKEVKRKMMLVFRLI